MLGVDVEASPHEITAAFAARARRTHPDVEGGSADAFREAVAARNLLLARKNAGSTAPDGYIVFDDEVPARTEAGDEFPYWVIVPRAPSPALIGVGGGLLLVAAFLSIYDVPYPWTLAEPIARWVVLIAAALAFAISGRRGFLAVMLVLVAATLVVNVAITTIGGLLGLFITMPAIVAINAAGFAARRRRTASHRATPGS